LDEVLALSQERAAIESALAQLDALSTRAADADAGGLTEAQAAAIDAEVAQWIELRRQLREDMAKLLATGSREGHREVRSANSSIQQLDRQIRDRMIQLQSGDGEGVDSGGTRKAELQIQLASVVDRLDRAQAKQLDIVKAYREMARLTTVLQDANADIDFVSARIDQLKTESQASDIAEVRGRVSIVSAPTRPSRPSSDRRVKLAMAGFVGGGGMPVALMMGIGLLSRRIRYSDDSILDAANSRIVGVLPDLGKSLTDRELAEASAFAVHQIRAQLQILHGRDRHAVYSVTSPAPGDGKTSMIIALGLSFAESGDRTLLIDLDLIGRGLSLHFGHPAAPSLADAAAGRGDLASLVQPSSFDRLSVLPAGLGDDLRISRLSPEVVSRMVELFRNDYETILIDSGPILGSIESGLLAPAVDGVLMVVGRNQLRPLVKRAADQIHAVGGQVIATIFNRASIQELKQSSSSMSVHFSRQASRQAAEQAARGGVKGGTSVGPLGGSLFPARPVESPGGGAAS
jgi:Mrp family chromosome partitioning ATPase